jgi:hypothetical protein
LGSWTYPALEKMVALCQVELGLAGLRPITRLEAARLTLKAEMDSLNNPVPLQAKMLIRKLQKEFSDELAYLGDTTGAINEVPSLPLRKAQATYTYRDGKRSASPGTDASQFALNFNNSGRRYSNYNNGELTLLGDLKFSDHLMFAWQPQLRYRDDGDLDLEFLELKAAVHFEGLELSVGRQSLWWGQGRHGSLLMTNNAQPLDMIRLTNPSPLQLPWVLKYLGPFRFDMFVSELDDDRVVPEPYFGGLRFNFKPVPWFEFGAARTVMFGGDGRPSTDLSDFLTIIGGENLTGNEDTSNSIAGVDVRLIMPFLYNAEVYGELYGEDEANMLPSKNSFLAGIYLPRLDPNGHVSLRVEYADTTRIGGGNPVFYRHSIYQSGHIYKDHIMGHHVGSDATDLSAEIRVDCTEQLSLNLLFDYEERGKELDLQEEHRQAQVGVDFWLTPNILINASYAYDDVKNYNFTKKDE